MKRLLCLLTFSLLLTACDSTENEPGECDDTADCLPPPAALFVGNQGNFSDGDGSVTAYDPETEQAREVVGGLGSIVQSVAVYGGRLYVTANTGGRVDVYDTASGSYERIGRIEIDNPRYVAYDGARGRLWITSQLYDRPSEVAVVDAQSLDVIATVEVGGLAEGVALAGDRVYVATGAFGATQEVVALDAGTNEVVDRIDVECTGPRSLAVDPGFEVWVFCTGAAASEGQDEISGEVVILSGSTGSEVGRIEIDGRIDTAGPGQDVYFAGSQGLFAIQDQNTVLRFDPFMNALRSSIAVEGAPIGAVAYDVFYDRLYLGRPDAANPFTARGSVTIHEASGEQVGQFDAGVLPSAIALTR